MFKNYYPNEFCFRFKFARENQLAKLAKNNPSFSRAHFNLENKLDVFLYQLLKKRIGLLIQQFVHEKSGATSASSMLETFFEFSEIKNKASKADGTGDSSTSVTGNSGKNIYDLVLMVKDYEKKSVGEDERKYKYEMLTALEKDFFNTGFQKIKELINEVVKLHEDVSNNYSKSSATETNCFAESKQNNVGFKRVENPSEIDAPFKFTWKILAAQLKLIVGIHDSQQALLGSPLKAAGKSALASDGLTKWLRENMDYLLSPPVDGEEVYDEKESLNSLLVLAYMMKNNIKLALQQDPSSTLKPILDQINKAISFPHPSGSMAIVKFKNHYKTLISEPLAFFIPTLNWAVFSPVKPAGALLAKLNLPEESPGGSSAIKKSVAQLRTDLIKALDIHGLMQSLQAYKSSKSNKKLSHVTTSTVMRAIHSPLKVRLALEIEKLDVQPVVSGRVESLKLLAYKVIQQVCQSKQDPFADSYKTATNVYKFFTECFIDRGQFSPMQQQRFLLKHQGELSKVCSIFPAVPEIEVPGGNKSKAPAALSSVKSQKSPRGRRKHKLGTQRKGNRKSLLHFPKMFSHKGPSSNELSGDGPVKKHNTGG